MILMKTSRLTITLCLVAIAAQLRGQEEPQTFGVWASSCCHVPADIRRGRESLAEAIRQSEGQIQGVAGFDWDIMIDAGDLSANQTPPGDYDGQELQRQYRALTKHRREQIYNVQGNHDAPYYDHGPGSWFRKWGDPIGEHTQFSGVDSKRRPFAVEGDWERYKFEAGNILFLMLADRNDAPSPVGRGHSSEQQRGGFPPGAVTRETFDWWREQVLGNQDKIIITMHHHALRDTTVASGNGEGNPRYHGSSGGAAGSSYLYFIIEKDDPDDFQFTPDAHVFEDFLDEFHQANGRGAIDFWIAGHTHVKGPDDNFGEKTITESRWGVNFLQAAALTRHHGGSHPLSRLLTFTDGLDQVTTRTYLHDASYQKESVGFYEPATRQLPLRHRFEAPPPIEPLPPFPGGSHVFEPSKPERPAPSTFPADGDAPELTKLWDRESGRLQIEEKHFDGKTRMRIGAIDMTDWTGLTFAARIKTDRNDPSMRIISKDRLGSPGNFILQKRTTNLWEIKVWDASAKKWAIAMWEANLSDDKWHHLCGVADAKRHKLLFYVDGEPRAQAAWNAASLDDSDQTELVIGADSGEKRFGQTFRGSIRDVLILARPLSDVEIKEVAEFR